MNWLLQNWLWIVLIIGVLWLLSRTRYGGLMRGGGTHHMAHEGPVTGGVDRSLPGKEDKSEQPAERSSSSHRHGRGGCC